MSRAQIRLERGRNAGVGSFAGGGGFDFGFVYIIEHLRSIPVK
jgi:hypothetical protein